MKPIGCVRSPVARQRTGGLRQVRAEIEVAAPLEGLLAGIEDFSHLWVLYWMSEVEESSVARTPQGREDVPVVGMLANR